MILKCVGCNSCIKSCPAKDANVASFRADPGRTVISIDSPKCIKCGSCIGSCTHKARDYRDDTEELFRALSAGDSISILVAPAIQNTFGESWTKVLSWLRSIGIKGV